MALAVLALLNPCWSASTYGAAAPLTASPAATDAAAIEVYIVLEGAPLFAPAPSSASRATATRPAVENQRRGAERMAQHAALQTRIEARGGVVTGHITRLGNAIRVRMSPATLAEAAAWPGVKRIFPVHRYERTMITAAPLVGAPAAWGALVAGADGRNVRVGVIDSGIDYTHADLGGSGKVEDYKKLDPVRVAPGTFPTAKVVGGFDFAGDDYNADDSTHAIPHPDPNPLDHGDEAGHGTHVAGILAGVGVLTNGQAYHGEYAAGLDYAQFAIGPGIAPRASLYALKVFGPTGTTSLAVDALEWAADPNGDYDPSDRLDVVNLSLGSNFGTGDPEDPEIVAVNNLTQLGCVVVCSAGNAGNIFYVSGQPGSASRAITVGNSIAAADTGALSVLSPEALVGLYGALGGQFTAPLAEVGPIVGEVVYAEPNDACENLQNPNALAGKIALIDRGTCLFVDKIQQAQDAGAIAVIMVDNRDEDLFAMGGENTPAAIPGVLISKADGQVFKAHLAAPLRVRLDATARLALPQFVDSVVDSSSRGPVALAPWLKPEIVAPGNEIYSAAMGTGTNGVSYTGTSMATPMVAGAAALMRQAHPAWTVEDLKAALMNTARPTHDDQYRPYPESLTGAGRLQVDQALRLEVTAATANAEGNVALGLGALTLAAPYQTNREIVLSNHGDNTLTFQVAVSNTVPQAGVSLTPVYPAVNVPAHGSVTVPFTFRANPAQFDPRPDATTPQTVDSLPRQAPYEASGEIWFLHEGQSLHVPYYASLRGASQYATPTNQIVLAAEVSLQKEVNLTIPIGGATANTNAVVSAFELGASFPRGTPLSIYDSAAYLLAVGAASDIATAGSVSNAHVYFGLATATSWATPQYGRVGLTVDIDTDGDGVADFWLRNGNASATNSDPASAAMYSADVFMTIVDGYDLDKPESGGFLNVFPADRLDTAPFNNSVMVQSAAASQLGLSDEQPRFRYRVRTTADSRSISQTGWILFDAAHPALDTASSGWEGTPFHADGEPLLARLDRQAAANTRQRLPGALLLHHHNLEGARCEVIRFDLSQDDVNNNGLPDWWEIQYFNNLFTASPDADSDGDGMSDRTEYLAGTDPTDPHSLLKLTAAASPEDNGVKLTWTSAPGKMYTLLSRESLETGAWQKLSEDLLATPPTNTYIDYATGDQPSGYYRIQVQ